MESIFNFLKFLTSPIYIVMTASTAILALMLGAIQNPTGAVNSFICRTIDIILVPIPTTPDNLKLGTMLTAFGNQFQIVGWGIVLDIIQTCVAMLLIVLVIKIYKLIPFKAS